MPTEVEFDAKKLTMISQKVPSLSASCRRLFPDFADYDETQGGGVIPPPPPLKPACLQILIKKRADALLSSHCACESPPATSREGQFYFLMLFRQAKLI